MELPEIVVSSIERHLPRHLLAQLCRLASHALFAKRVTAWHRPAPAMWAVVLIANEANLLRDLAHCLDVK